MPIRTATAFALISALVAASPAQAIPGPFIIFFEFDSAELSPAAPGILENQLETLRVTRPRGFVISGHTDRAGSIDYNQRLSCHRARAVRDWLVARGLSPEIIDVAGFGEERPSVETEDGIAEVQNRRVELTPFPDHAPSHPGSLAMAGVNYIC
jgi:outer membrane protein OmpA-like peptidoglycan-associated protein